MNNICPECRDGKCRNCDSSAWDDETDQPCVCDCWTDYHNTGDI